MEHWSQRGWRSGAGFGLGAGWMPGIASGPAAAAHVEAVRTLAGAFAGDQARLQTGLRGLALARVDFERTVFVAGKPWLSVGSKPFRAGRFP